MSKIKNGGLDLDGAEPFEQQQFGTAGVEGVNDGSLQLQLHLWETVLLAKKPVFYIQTTSSLQKIFKLLMLLFVNTENTL